MRPVPILFVALFALLLTACDATTTELTIVRPAEIVDRGIVEELEQVLEMNSPYRVSLTDDTLTESEALDAVAAGTADFALVSNHLLFRDDISTVMPLYPTVLHIGANGAVGASCAGTHPAVSISPLTTAARSIDAADQLSRVRSSTTVSSTEQTDPRSTSKVPGCGTSSSFR